MQRDKPLGWDYGSDSNQLESGMVIYNNNFVSRFIYSNRKSGEENIKYIYINIKIIYLAVSQVEQLLQQTLF